MARRIRDPERVALRRSARDQVALRGPSGKGGALRICVCLLLALTTLSCGSHENRSAGQRRIAIAAAADLKFALDELTAAFRREHPAIELAVSYGSSGNLYTQIVNSAPFDLFLSADVEYPRQLAAQGFTLPSSEFVYAIGRLAIWVPAGSPFDLTRGVAAAGEAAHVAIANPVHAPYGRAAIAAMRTAGVYEKVSPKLVYGENVAQALQLVQSGAAEIGVVALSLAVAPTNRSAGRYVEVPPDTFPGIQQGGAIIKRTADPDAAWTVRAFLMSESAAAVFKRYGFALPGSR